MFQYGLKKSILGIISFCLVIGLLFSFNVQAKINAHQIDGLTPSNTTIDLFDYAISHFGENDNRGLPGNYHHLGINKDHQLKFTKDFYGPMLKSINTWTGRQLDNLNNGSPFKNIVMDQLVNGYPVIKEGNLYDDTHKTYQESLDYLFNHEESTHKRVYKNVTNLLTLNDKGFYNYDSRKNYAEFNEKSNSFILYDQPAIGVNPNQTSDHQFGQFFPFSSLASTDGKDSLNGYLNHFFGLHMTSHFMQPKDGLVANKQAMQFNFSGDDDVWVFIDGILVGDVGGIHDRLKLTIDFHEGYASVSEGASYVSESRERSRVYFKDIDGLKHQLNKQGRLKDGTYHTLDFFFLERGHGNSNLMLETNLVDIPKSDLIKINQRGDYVDGAEFELYQTDASYHVNNNTLPLSKGQTKRGIMTFVDKSDNVIDFGARYSHDHNNRYYVLREVNAPKGYRKLPDIKLSYEPDKLGLVCHNMWETGAVSRGSMNITAPSDVEVYKSNEMIHLDENSKLFAVILKRVSKVGSLPSQNDEWKAVSGDSLSGYKYYPIDSLNDINASYITKYPLVMSSEGKHQVTIEGLPGEVSKYYDNLSDSNKAQAEYAIGYYIEDNGKLKRLESKHFERVYGNRITMTDPKNQLYVQKVNEKGEALNNVEFSLFLANDVINGNLRKGAKAIDKKTTQALTMAKDGIDLNGGIIFGHLEPGIYYLQETSALPGYSINNQLIKVIVKEGVHVDAGSKDDGVQVEVGVGSLMSSMAMFGINDDYNHTLTDIIATLQIANDQSLNWQDTDHITHLSYRVSDQKFQYRPTIEGQQRTFIIDEGFGQMKVKQDYTDGVLKENLGDLDVSSLYSGMNIVKVANHRVANLVIEKEATQPEKLKNDIFQFEIDFHDQSMNQSLDAHLHSRKTGLKIDEKILKVVNGKTSFTLHAGEYLGILALPPHVQYTIKEVNNSKYRLTSIRSLQRNLSSSIDLSKGSVSGSMSNQEVNHYIFTNEYQYEPIKTHFDFQKLYNGWDKTPHISFDIACSSGLNTPMPQGAIEMPKYERQYVKMNINYENKDKIMNFGEITYHKPGLYSYMIKELVPENKHVGVGYSSATYLVIVNVEDKNSDGQLSINQKMICIQDDQGNNSNKYVDKAVFNNIFTNDKAFVNIIGLKKYINFYNDHDFYIQLNPLSLNAPQCKNNIIKVSKGAPSFDFNLEFNQRDINQTYEYELKEVLNELGEPIKDSNGVIYDQSIYKIRVHITKSTNQQGIEYLVPKVSYYKDNKEVKDIVFENSYQAKGKYHLTLTKKLVGRDFNEHDSFTFFVENVLGDKSFSKKSVTISNLKGNNALIDFGNISFDKPGQYIYHIYEQVKDDDTMLYDQHVIELRLNVIDLGNGQLEVRDESSDELVFTNTHIPKEEPVVPIIPQTPDSNVPPINPNIPQVPINPKPENNEDSLIVDTSDQHLVLPYFIVSLASFGIVIILLNKYRKSIK